MDNMTSNTCIIMLNLYEQSVEADWLVSKYFKNSYYFSLFEVPVSWRTVFLVLNSIKFDIKVDAFLVFEKIISLSIYVFTTSKHTNNLLCHRLTR